jgi:hypothetical protein
VPRGCVLRSPYPRYSIETACCLPDTFSELLARKLPAQHVRISDKFAEEGVSEDELDRWVQTASILHSNGGVSTERG